MKSDVQVNVEADRVLVKAPYNPDFPSEARLLGGKWRAPLWVFDSRDEERVRELCRLIYGTDGTGCNELVTLRVTVTGHWAEQQDGIYLAGRQVARAFGRDSGAKLGPGVVVLSGRFDSGGSVKNWTTECKAGTIFELRDVPRRAAEKEADENGGCTIEIIGGEAVIDVEALTHERERLLARIAEIDLMLNKTDQQSAAALATKANC